MRKIKIGDTVVDWIGAAECWGAFFSAFVGLVSAAVVLAMMFWGWGGGGDGLEGRLVRWGDEDGKG